MPPAEPTRAALPRTAGGFHLHKELGRGGMGVVYEAQEISSGRRVALKVLLADLAVSEEAFERFRREARIAASVSDHRCVFVYGAHQIEGAPAISMELCPGETLDHRLTRGEPIPIETAVRWMIEIIDGLEAANAAGVVHRDVKPSNCFITEDGHVKVGDFGLARSLDLDVRLTLTGQFLGSPLYASPEQIKGRLVDLRSDLYSCGATLYALLSGRAPHSGTNIGEVLSSILSEDPTSLRKLRSEIPRGLEKIVVRAMDREPRRRYQTHADMRAALQMYAVRSATPATPGRRFLSYVLDDMALLAIKWLFATAAPSLGISLAQAELGRPWPDAALAGQILVNVQMLVYFALTEGLLGFSPGKWLTGQKVVVEAGRALLPRATLRVLIFMLPNLIAAGLASALDLGKLSQAPFVYFAGGVLTIGLMSSMRKRNGWRGMHERLSGTRVIQRRVPFASIVRAAPPPSAPLVAAPGLPAQIGRYVVEGAVGESPFGLVMGARDPSLNRAVWISDRPQEQLAHDDARRSLSRAGRLRWLDSLAQDGRDYEIFEAPGGSSFLALIEGGRRFHWPTMYRILATLAEEVGSGSKDRLSLEQLWIDRSWNVRLLDVPIGRGPFQTYAPPEFLVASARALLRTSGSRGAVLPADLPLHAELAARRIFGIDAPFATMAEVSTALAQMEDKPLALARGTRAAQLMLCASPAVALALLTYLVAWIYAGPLKEVGELERLARELKDGQMQIQTGIGEDGTPEYESRPLDEKDVEAREILLSYWFANFNTSTIRVSIDGEYRATLDGARERHPEISADEVGLARRRIGERPVEESPSSVQLRKLPAVSVLAILFIWGFFASVFALLFRGGLSLNAFDVRVRNKRGEQASRFRCACRAMLISVALVALYTAPALAVIDDRHALVYLLGAVAVGLHAAAIAYAIARPSRSLVDHVAGTRLVPR